VKDLLDAHPNRLDTDLAIQDTDPNILDTHHDLPDTLIIWILWSFGF